ncbi:hypothetical protein GCM10027073_47200 [Streptomyces chlorus]|uniref:Secreted protein n=1 Tax=Streptomyces chlorus TaxID=887452 RepID=A0ABW1E0I6_9ACTN
MILGMSSLRRESLVLLVTQTCLMGREVAPVDVFAQTASVVEGLDEVEDVGAGGGPVGPEAGADLFFQYGPGALRGGVVEAAAGPVPLGKSSPQAAAMMLR